MEAPTKATGERAPPSLPLLLLMRPDTAATADIARETTTLFKCMTLSTEVYDGSEVVPTSLSSFEEERCIGELSRRVPRGRTQAQSVHLSSSCCQEGDPSLTRNKMNENIGLYILLKPNYTIRGNAPNIPGHEVDKRLLGDIVTNAFHCCCARLRLTSLLWSNSNTKVTTRR